MNKLRSFRLVKVTACSEGITRGEVINLKTNALFVRCKNLGDVEAVYESFWNGKVVVLGVAIIA
jgi:hypothetical protein